MQQMSPNEHRYLTRWLGAFMGTLLVFLGSVMLVAWRIWPLWSPGLAILFFLAIVSGMVFHLLRHFRVPDRLRIAWRMQVGATR